MLSKKKAFFSLEMLVSVVLSTVVLIMLLSVFFQSFTNKSPNEIIGENNAKEIIEFIDYSNEIYYESVPYCYNTLKISQTNTYQVDKGDSDKEFFYLINEEGIAVIKKTNFRYYLFENNDVERFFEGEMYKFSKPANIYVDYTDDGNSFLSSMTLDMFFRPDQILDLRKENIRYTLMVPNLGNDNEYEIIVVMNEKNSCANPNSPCLDSGYKTERFVNSDNLVYDPINNNLFFSKGIFTDSLVFGELCTVKREILKTDIESIFEQGQVIVLDEELNSNLILQKIKIGRVTRDSVLPELRKYAYVRDCAFYNFLCSETEKKENLIFINSDLFASYYNPIIDKYEIFNPENIDTKYENPNVNYYYDGKEINFKDYWYKSLDKTKEKKIYVAEILFEGSKKEIYLTSEQLKAAEYNK